MSLRRKPVSPAAQSRTESKSFPAPSRGWVSGQNLAGNAPGTAVVLENWFPTETGIRMFGGSLKHATIGTDPVESLMAYVSTTRELFAADETNIFNITSPADPDVAPTADVTGQTSGYYCAIAFATAGGNFMYALNGTDDPQLYDGTAWTTITNVSAPIAITGTTDTNKLTQGTVYRERIFMVERDSLNVWALPAGALGGAAIQISLAGVFKKGGSVKLVETWSLDSGSGLDDKCVIVSTEGEVAVYQGSDPSDPADWSIVGLYEIPPPMGKNATMRAGGDLVILTTQGAIPISQAVAKDRAALGLTAVSRAIGPDWVRDAAARSALPWEFVKWPSKAMGLVTNPVPADDVTSQAQMYAVNLQTGAWCKRTGWAARCTALHDDGVYFGTNAGTVYLADTTGGDDGSPYVCKVVFGWDHLGAQGYYKTLVSARAQFLASTAFDPQISASVDYYIDLPLAPNTSQVDDSGTLWDAGIWDESVWDGGGVEQPISTRWLAIGASGSVHAPQLQITSGKPLAPEVELVALDVLFERAEIMQ